MKYNLLPETWALMAGDALKTQLIPMIDAKERLLRQFPLASAVVKSTDMLHEDSSEGAEFRAFVCHQFANPHPVLWPVHPQTKQIESTRVARPILRRHTSYWLRLHELLEVSIPTLQQVQLVSTESVLPLQPMQKHSWQIHQEFANDQSLQYLIAALRTHVQPVLQPTNWLETYLLVRDQLQLPNSHSKVLRLVGITSFVPHAFDGQHPALVQELTQVQNNAKRQVRNAIHGLKRALSAAPKTEIREYIADLMVEFELF